MRKEQTPERIIALIKQFPFLESVVDMRRLKQGQDYMANIRVERMDEKLMFFVPELTDETSGAHLVGSGVNEGRAGTLHPSVFTVLSFAPAGKSNWRWWYQNDKTTIGDYLSQQSSRLDQITYLVYVQDMEWYDILPNWTDHEPRTPFGELKRSERLITVYRTPQKRKGGLRGLYENASFSKHAHLSIYDLTGGVIEQRPEYVSVNREIDALIDRFVSSVYNQGLRSRIDQSRVKGMSGMFGDVKLATWVMCGRVMLTLSRKNVQVTFLAAEDGPPRMGLQSINGTLPEVRDVVQTVIDVFENNDPCLPMPYTKLNDDKKIGLSV